MPFSLWASNAITNPNLTPLKNKLNSKPSMTYWLTCTTQAPSIPNWQHLCPVERRMLIEQHRHFWWSDTTGPHTCRLALWPIHHLASHMHPGILTTTPPGLTPAGWRNMPVHSFRLLRLFRSWWSVCSCVPAPTDACCMRASSGHRWAYWNLTLHRQKCYSNFLRLEGDYFHYWYLFYFSFIYLKGNEMQNIQFYKTIQCSSTIFMLVSIWIIFWSLSDDYLSGELVIVCKESKVFYGQEPPIKWRIYYHRMWGQLSTNCSNVLKQPNGELLIVVNHNQLRIMASETVDPIDCPPHPHGRYPWAPRASYKSVPPLRELMCNRSMQGNHHAYEATQGIKERHQEYCFSLLAPQYIDIKSLNLIDHIYETCAGKPNIS